MKNLEILTREQAAPETQGIFDALKKKVGKVPHLYATIAHSHKGLNALLTLGDNLNGGEFSAKEGEAIALAVGESNACTYCLSAHTAIGKMVGFTEEETVQLRTGAIEDTKLSALTKLAKAITEKNGLPDQALIEEFFAAGYNKAALVELVGHVTKNIFTNYINHIAETTVDFPEVTPLVASNA
ncbi:carboxymuconolactone decarboxylase family protein [Microscilla marina]|uniref:Alkylhydroperoxidase AhpD family core domain protein n=1 Tax=Microscilla marina ATCC 23134 TaxID=313606 RepID=A1ZCW7_MICM2|nr:carboxymuconolactone decarboxylase family protein [Microscilla marina]EAY31506.1 alkylhydroperoxidase AhpD family core domain protein [Microscilla marina ATCC 23134]